MEITIHYVQPVRPGNCGLSPHYSDKPWVQPTTDGMVDTRLVHAEAEPVKVTVPDETVLADSAQGLTATGPDGAVSFADCWPAPIDDRLTPDDWW